MTTILTIIHVTVCVFLIVIVLLQQGKGADMGAAFGGSSQTVFGTDGPLPLLNKITTGSAVIFMLTSITLAYYSANATKGSVMEAAVPPPPPVETQMEAAPTPVDVPLERASTGEDGLDGEDVPATFPGEAAGDGQPETIAPAEEAPETAAPAPVTDDEAPAAAAPDEAVATPREKARAATEAAAVPADAPADDVEDSAKQ